MTEEAGAAPTWPDPEIEIAAPALPHEAIEIFRQDVASIVSIYRSVLDELALPGAKTRLVLTDDFAATIDRVMPARLVANEGAEFSTTREGGVVAAKTLDLVGDMSEAAIVFDASHWAAAHEGPSERVLGLRLIAHELAHVIIDRTLHVAGAMADVVVPSITGSEVARSSGRILAGEYRADVLADVVVGQIVSMNVNGGEAQPYRHWGPDRDRYLGGILALLEGAGERWPDTVQDYRERRIPLEQMWGAIVQTVDQTLTLIVHAQAGADVAEAREDVLTLSAIAPLAATRIYLAEPFAAFLTQLRRSPVLPTVAEAAEAEARVVAAGEAMNLEMVAS